MESLALALSIDKGPKKGETIGCKPGSSIRIGRVVRGNTLAIKESGISQKHLTIHFLPDIARWVVTDQGSSNGTYINGALILPNEPSPIADGDIIKVGAQTSIYVHISSTQAKQTSHERLPTPPNVTALEDDVEKADELAKAVKGVRERGGKKRGFTRISQLDKHCDPAVVRRRVMTRGLAKVLKRTLEDDERTVKISDSNSADDKRKMQPSKESNANLEGEERIVEDVVDDMDDMSLGEWFIRMETYLPRAINKVADEIIEKLREKARLFEEYASLNSNFGVE